MCMCVDVHVCAHVHVSTHVLVCACIHVCMCALYVRIVWRLDYSFVDFILSSPFTCGSGMELKLPGCHDEFLYL